MRKENDPLPLLLLFFLSFVVVVVLLSTKRVHPCFTAVHQLLVKRPLEVSCVSIEIEWPFALGVDEVRNSRACQQEFDIAKSKMLQSTAMLHATIGSSETFEEAMGKRKP